MLKKNKNEVNISADQIDAIDYEELETMLDITRYNLAKMVEKREKLDVQIKTLEMSAQLIEEKINSEE